METKFILHGGVTSRDNPHNDSFFAELSKNLKDGDTILFVGFARESEEEQESGQKMQVGTIEDSIGL